VDPVLAASRLLAELRHDSRGLPAPLRPGRRVLMLGVVDQKPTYWQSEAANARPTAAVLWVGRHRLATRMILAAWGLVVIIMLVFGSLLGLGWCVNP
jgi:hypothetical protein